MIGRPYRRRTSSAPRSQRPSHTPMKRLSILFALTTLTSVTACDRGKLRELARVDSLRSDSLVRIKDEMLNEVMTSTQFVNDLNSEIAKLKTPVKVALTPKEAGESAA